MSARIWQYDKFHDTAVTIQYIAIHCATVSKDIYCFIGLHVYLLLPVSVHIVTLERTSQMAEEKLQRCYLPVRVLALTLNEPQPQIFVNC